MSNKKLQSYEGSFADWYAINVERDPETLLLKVQEVIKERNHWIANHDNQVARARILIERDDLPLERVKAYIHMCKMQEVVDAAIALVQSDVWPETYDGKLIHALKEGGFLK